MFIAVFALYVFVTDTSPTTYGPNESYVKLNMRKYDPQIPLF